MGNTVSTFHKTLQDIRKNDPSLSELNFKNFSLGDNRMQSLAEALRANNTLQRLILTNTACTAIGVRSLSDTLVNSLFTCNIHTLVIDNNPIGPDGAQYLSMALATGTSLVTLKANGCALGDDGVVAICKGLSSNKTLLTLELGSNSCGDRAAAAVGRALKVNETLEGLSLWKNGILAGGAKSIFCDGLSTNASLQWLGLGGNAIGAEGAGFVAQGLSTNEGLQWLALGGNGLGDQGAVKIAAVLKDDGCQLQSIGLGGNGITDQGVRYVCAALWTNTFIESLGLGGNSVSNEGCEHLAEMMKHNKYIRKLIVSSNIIEDDGVKALADGLTYNETVTTLLLAGNPFTDSGGQYLTHMICDKNKTLLVLDIHNSNMTESIERGVVEKLRADSKLALLGSHYGRRDHRIIRVGDDEEVGSTGAYVSPAKQASSQAPATYRGSETF
eukprot:m.155241 g.155241  ORF g.155241 m.155241 type:complete len:443 (+) comp23555_c0_seq1:90-1418(+)